MKWFFALNEGGNEFSNYADMAKVAVHTALEHTRLEPYFIYDGEENDLTAWMRNREVTIIRKRTFLYDALKEVAAQKGWEGYLNIGAGTFLRLEIPQIAEEYRFPDNFVLYTDLDVMFKGEVCDYLETLRPRYFAVAPEAFKTDYYGINAGVMLMNVEGMRKKDPAFRQYIKENLSMLVDNSFDQAAYRLFFQRNRVARKLIGHRWTKLKIEYNWKPYWGTSPDARIIHFHGPKPYQAEVLLSDEVPGHMQSLKPMMSEAFFEYAKEWSRALKEVDLV